jgi:hypothetical protein
MLATSVIGYQQKKFTFHDWSIGKYFKNLTAKNIVFYWILAISHLHVLCCGEISS